MITIICRHVVIEVRGINTKDLSKKDFKKSIDEVCTSLKKNADDIKHFTDNYQNGQFNLGHQLRIYI